LWILTLLLCYNLVWLINRLHGKCISGSDVRCIGFGFMIDMCRLKFNVRLWQQLWLWMNVSIWVINTCETQFICATFLFCFLWDAIIFILVIRNILHRLLILLFKKNKNYKLYFFIEYHVKSYICLIIKILLYRLLIIIF